MKVVNYAAWIPSHGAQLEVADAPFPTDIGDDEVVIKNKAVAVNPVDWKIQSAPEPIFNIKYREQFLFCYKSPISCALGLFPDFYRPRDP